MAILTTQKGEKRGNCGTIVNGLLFMAFTKVPLGRKPPKSPTPAALIIDDIVIAPMPVTAVTPKLEDAAKRQLLPVFTAIVRAAVGSTCTYTSITFQRESVSFG